MSSPGAKAVDARAAVAIPVDDEAGNVRAVVGIAFLEERDFSSGDLEHSSAPHPLCRHDAEEALCLALFIAAACAPAQVSEGLLRATSSNLAAAHRRRRGGCVEPCERVYPARGADNAGFYSGSQPLSAPARRSLKSLQEGNQVLALLSRYCEPEPVAGNQRCRPSIPLNPVGT